MKLVNDDRSAVAVSLQRISPAIPILTRRCELMKAILFFILGFLIVSVVGLTMPYPPSTIGITFDWSSHAQAAAQSDNWPITWAGDGEQYTSWGDGRGFNQTATLDLGVSKIIGDSPETYTGLDMWTQKDGKSVGIIAVDGLLYFCICGFPQVHSNKPSKSSAFTSRRIVALAGVRRLGRSFSTISFSSRRFCSSARTTPARGMSMFTPMRRHARKTIL